MVTRVSGTTSIGPISGPITAPSNNVITQNTGTTNITAPISVIIGSTGTSSGGLVVTNGAINVGSISNPSGSPYINNSLTTVAGTFFIDQSDYSTKDERKSAGS